MAALLRRLPFVLLEQNSSPGLVTRLFAPFARRVCVSFAETAEQLRGAAVVTGNPVRWRSGSIRALSQRKADVFRVLVFGGSAGAHRLNLVVPGALGRVTGSLSVVHQTGQADQEAVAAQYRSAGIEARVMAFIDDMEVAYRDADLAICRAGATTIAELTALGVPAVLVPYPFAAGDHQRRNAESLVRAKAAWMIDEAGLDETSLAAIVQAARDDPVVLAERRAAALSLGRPDAVLGVVEECLAAIDSRAEGGKVS
jgi:UDP-N-acetylglucosamine--N-acetylmuramyl-(pentapeptide) pyrophosphoryl-undecaprenol N-acetylglucosamine transferase